MAKMRYVLKKEEIDSLLEGDARVETKWIENKNERSSVYKGIIAAGDAKALLSLIRCLYEKRAELAEAGKKLPASDSGILESAEKMIREEFAFVLDIEESSVADYIVSKIGK